MRYGHFDQTRREYVIDRVDVPVSWINYLGVEDMAAVVNHAAGGYVNSLIVSICVTIVVVILAGLAAYQARYNALADQFEKAKERLEAVSMEITEKQARREMAEQCLAELAKQKGVVTEFDETLWYALVDYVTVHGKEDVRFTFKDGTEIKV